MRGSDLVEIKDVGAQTLIDGFSRSAFEPDQFFKEAECPLGIRGERFLQDGVWTIGIDDVLDVVAQIKNEFLV